eukprot:CAMPEP_0197450036 /NCGR_PEP_ID=MMETSP1175-20131217/23746_1 /TAXON_ID=1003142 /ORGANISM="Triceratium dubium, Strain CCMP147" /LENGTH=75 /DNA_ID=CAMNT_0042982353 /DNA_START=52 /DNA_END=279 /DNA_ORIENTATION=+
MQSLAARSVSRVATLGSRRTFMTSTPKMGGGHDHRTFHPPYSAGYPIAIFGIVVGGGCTVSLIAYKSGMSKAPAQ